MRRYHLFGPALIAAMAMATSGCGPGLVKVTGKVTLDGQPVEGAVVVFEQGGGHGRPASGQTDSDGVFELGTFKTGDGAFPGDYKVMILPPQATPRERPTPGMSMGEAMALYAKFKEEQKKNPDLPFGSDIAAKYRDPSQTPLRQTVPAEGPVVFDVLADATAKKRSTRSKTGIKGVDPMMPSRKR